MSRSPDQSFVRLDRDDAVATVILDRPDRLNAWHAEMRAEVIEVVAELGEDDDVAAVVLTGAGDRAFSAGQDLAESAEFDPSQSGWWVDEWRRLYGALRALDKPVVAAIRGVAAGSAFQFSLLADVRVAHPDARLGQPEIRSGLPSPLGLWLLEQRVGLSRATELILTGRMMDGEEAHACGLVHHLVAAEEVRPRAVAVAAELAMLPTGAMRLNKRLLRERSEPGFAAALEAGHHWHQLAYGSGEPQALMARFLASRR